MVRLAMERQARAERDSEGSPGTLEMPEQQDFQFHTRIVLCHFGTRVLRDVAIGETGERR